MKRLIASAVLFFCLFLMGGAVASEEVGYGHITGKVVLSNGQPLSDCSVSFFDAKAGPSPHTLEYWRVSEFRVRTDEEGGFSKQLPDGAYYVVVLKKRAGSKSGNPEEGDLIFPPGDEREPSRYLVRAGQTTDIGVISGAVPFKREWIAQGKTGIRGTVFDKNRTPAEGARVYAHRTPGKEIPLFGSDGKTGKDGKYLVRVPEGGRYFLIVSGYRKPDAVTVNTGEMTIGIDVYLPENP